MQVGGIYTTITLVTAGFSRGAQLVCGKLKEVGKRLGEVAKSAEPAEEAVTKTEVAADRASPAFTSLAQAIGTLGLGRFTIDMTRYAAKIEMLGVAVVNLGRVHNVTRGEIMGVEESIKALGITTETARITMTRFIQYELDLAQVAKLARVAQDAAAIANVNSSETLERLVHGIVTLQPRVIRTAGLVTNFANAQRRWARENKRTYDSLTGNEKVMIGLNDVIEKGAAIYGTYEVTMGVVGKRATSLKRFFDEMRLSLGNHLIPVMGDLVDGATAAMVAITGLGKQTGAIISSIAGATVVFGGLVVAAKTLAWALGFTLLPVFGPITLAVGALAGAYLYLRARQRIMIEGWREEADEIRALIHEIFKLKAAREPLTAEQKEELARTEETVATRMKALRTRAELLALELQQRTEEEAWLAERAERMKKFTGEAAITAWGPDAVKAARLAAKALFRSRKDIEKELQAATTALRALGFAPEEEARAAIDRIVYEIEQGYETVATIGEQIAARRMDILKDEEGQIRLKFAVERRQLENLKESYEKLRAAQGKLDDKYEADLAEINQNIEDSVRLEEFAVATLRKEIEAQRQIIDLKRQGFTEAAAELIAESTLAKKLHEQRLDILRTMEDQVGIAAELEKHEIATIENAEKTKKLIEEYTEALLDFDISELEKKLGGTSEEFKSAMKEIDKHLRDKAYALAEMETEGLGQLRSMFEEARDMLDKLHVTETEGVEQATAKMGEVMKAFSALSDAEIGKVRDALGDLQEDVDKATRALEDAKKRLQELLTAGPKGALTKEAEAVVRRNYERRMEEIEKRRQRIVARRGAPGVKARRLGRLEERAGRAREQFIGQMLTGLSPGEKAEARADWEREIAEARKGADEAAKRRDEAQKALEAGQQRLNTLTAEQNRLIQIGVELQLAKTQALWSQAEPLKALIDLEKQRAGARGAAEAEKIAEMRAARAGLGRHGAALDKRPISAGSAVEPIGTLAGASAAITGAAGAVTKLNGTIDSFAEETTNAMGRIHASAENTAGRVAVLENIITRIGTGAGRVARAGAGR